MKRKHIMLTSTVLFIGTTGLFAKLSQLGIFSSNKSTFSEIEIQYNIEYGTHPKQKLDLCKPTNVTKDLPGVMLIHGGGGDKQSFLATCKALAKRGLVAVTINFREEPPPSYENILADTNSAYGWLLNQEEVDSNKMGVMGGSLGGYIASMLGTQDHQNKPICTENNFGPTDFTDPNFEPSAINENFVEKFFGGVTHDENPELYINLSPITHVTDDDSPQWFFTRSKNDKLVPRTQMILMVDKLKTAGLQTKFYEYFGFGRGHANKMLPWSSKKLFNKRVNFLVDCLN